jgi:uncharacterized protein DUF11
MQRVLLLVALCAMASLATVGLAAGAGARAAATADLDISLVAAPGSPPHQVGTPFSIGVGIGNSGPDASRFRVRILLPEGIRLVSPGALECTGTKDLTCFADEAPVGYNADGTTAVVADAPGSYTLVARLTELTTTDPNLANNEATLTVKVAAAPHVIAAVGLAVAPSKPRAGTRFMVSFRVLDRTAGRAVVPAAARCSVTLGRAQARVVGGRVTCAITTPRSASGRTVRGVVTAVAGNRRLAKRFSIRLR